MPRTFLDDVPPVDWDDIETAHVATTAVLQRLANDRETLRALVLGVEDDPALLGKCEIHSLDDKIVIYDALERSRFRIRLRLATSYQDERPHNHRFSFTTLILRGRYHQTWYRARAPLDEGIDVADIEPVCSRDEPAGSGFTIHHDTLHSTVTPVDTVSLLMRGPSAKKRAILTHKPSGRVWWRYGETDEPPERREEVRMPLARYHEWCRRLEAYGIL
jgi:hypothetical protein